MKIQECIQQLIQELAPDQGASPSRAFTLALSLQAAMSAKPATTQSPGWTEVFLVDDDDGPPIGIQIELPDGGQIWTGEVSDSLLSEAAAVHESPDGSGIYLAAAAKGDGARVIASVGTVNDAEDLARGLAMLWSEASTTSPDQQDVSCRECGGKGYTEYEGGDGEGYPSNPVIENCSLCTHPAPASDELRSFPYQRTFNAIADAVTWQPNKSFGISVEAFERSFNAKHKRLQS